MSKARPAQWTATDYERAALAYLRGLPLEHFMEAIPQATQREITLESLALLKARHPDLQVFNELLVQYFHRGRLRQVVPDNMVVSSAKLSPALTSFNLEMEPAPPFWVLEYVSPSNPRKDYEDSFKKYERELRVPYYLVFHPQEQELLLYHHTGKKYVPVAPNAEDRLPIPELKLEVGLLDSWVRFWYEGRLLDLPADLQRRLEDLQAQLDQAKKEVRQEKRRAEQEKQRAEQEKQRAEQEKQRAEQIDQQRAAAEAEVDRLRALLAQLQGTKPAPFTERRKGRGRGNSRS